jgi:predicted alpha/beta hydrolase
MQVTDERWPCADGFQIPATVYAPPRARAALVLAPAMGVPRPFYRGFAAAMAQDGIATITFDYRGIGEGRQGLADPRATRLEDWGHLDLHAALEQAFARFPGLPVFQAGHSVGAQLPGLTPLSERLAGFVFVAASAPHLRYDAPRRRPLTALWWYVIVPLASRGRWFPARRLGFAAADVPAGVAADWGRFGRSPRYLFSPVHGIDTSRYARLAQPALSFTFSDDAYAPRAAAEALLREYPKLSVTRRHVRPADVGARAVGHAGFFREPVRETLWRETADWLLARALGAASSRAA